MLSFWVSFVRWDKFQFGRAEMQIWREEYLWLGNSSAGKITELLQNSNSRWVKRGVLQKRQFLFWVMLRGLFHKRNWAFIQPFSELTRPLLKSCVQFWKDSRKNPEGRDSENITIDIPFNLTAVYFFNTQKNVVSRMIHLIKYYWLLKCSSKIIYVTEKTGVWTVETSCKEVTLASPHRKTSSKGYIYPAWKLSGWLQSRSLQLGEKPVYADVADRDGIKFLLCVLMKKMNEAHRLQRSKSVKLAPLTIITLALQLLSKITYARAWILRVKTEFQGCSVVYQNLRTAIAQCFTAGPLVGVSLRPGICSIQNPPFILLGKRGNKPSKQGKAFTIPNRVQHVDCCLHWKS